MAVSTRFWLLRAVVITIEVAGEGEALAVEAGAVEGDLEVLVVVGVSVAAVQAEVGDYGKDDAKRSGRSAQNRLWQ